MAQAAGERMRRRARTAFGQQSTILTSGQQMATAQAKTLLGS